MGVVHTLQLYLAAGILQPGPKKLSCSVGGEEHYADLGSNGQIFFEGLEFSTPSSFSLYIKRKQNPLRKADDGWTSVKYDGTTLFELRELYDLRGDGDGIGSNAGAGRDRAVQSHDLSLDCGGERGHQPESQRANGTGGLLSGNGELAPGGNAGGGAEVLEGHPGSKGSHSGDELAKGSNQEGGMVVIGDGEGALNLGGNHAGQVCDLNTNAHPVEGQNWPCQHVGQHREGAAFKEKRAWPAESNDRVKGEPEQERHTGESNPGDETWILCEKCDRWRRIKVHAIPDGPWHCWMNPNKRYASCDTPQEMSDAEIDKLLEEEQLRRYTANSKRPPLDVCTSSEFEADIIAFLRELGENVKADHIRTKRVQCNNRPLDVFGLYKAVVECGGLLANEKYDENGRWIGTINFAGIIFPKLHNYTKDNRATSVGNQLLSNYRKFLYDYERAWRHIDILGAGLNPGETADNELQPVVKAQPNAMTLKPEQLEDGKGTCEDAAGIGGSGSGAASGETDVSGSSARRYSALLMLAGIMCAERDSGKTPGPSAACCNGQPLQCWKKQHREGAAPEEAAAPAVCPHETCAEAVARQPAAAPSAARDLLLARDPNRPGRLWPVVVAVKDDLPASVAKGYSNEVAKWVGFPLSFKDLIPGALPVMVFGSDALGWAHEGLCQPFDADLAMIMYQEALRCDNPSNEQIFYRRVLKQGLQYAADPSPAFINCVQRVSLDMVASNLIGLESDLPTEVLGGQSFSTWHQWRLRVRKAETAAGLASEALLLFYQIDPDVIRRGASGLWPELERLLGIGQTKEPTILSVDMAINLMKDTIDWIRTYRRLQASMQGKTNSFRRTASKRKTDDLEGSKGGTGDVAT